MAISIDLVKELRKITHAPLGDCKKALEEVGGDLEKAQEVLKQKGLSKASKKSDRETGCGVVRFTTKNGSFVGVRVNCETDFVAQNAMFLDLIDKLISQILEIDGQFTLDSLSEEQKKSLQSFLDEHVATIGEKLQLSMVVKESGEPFVYNHMGNTISSAVWYEGGTEDQAKLLALQVAAMNPKYISMDDIPSSEIEEKKSEFLEELKGSGKPQDIIEKIAEGRVYKLFQDDVLLEQNSIKDPTVKLKDAVKGLSLTKILRENIG